MEGLNVIVSHLNGCLKLRTYQCLSLVHLGFGYSKCGQVDMVELQLITLHSIVAALLYVGQYRCYGVVELRNIKVWTLHNLCPLASLRVSYNDHNIIFSIGVTRMPWAPISFSLPIISQNCFWSRTV